MLTDFGYTQNTEHRLESITNTWNGGSNNYTNHTYGYDAVGRLETWTKDVLPSGSGNVWTMGYDASEQLETVAVTSWTGAQPTPVNADFHLYEYDAAGNRTSEQRSGAVRSWTPNAFNQLTQQTAGGKMELRGNVNPKSKVTVTPVNTAGTPIGGAIAATAESGATQWKARTNVGEGVRRFSVRAEQTQVPQGLTPEVTTKTLQVNVPAESAVTFSYDADGNMLGNGIWTYKWDAENRLVSAKIPASTDGTEVTFNYDAFHRRVKVVETLGATTLSAKTLMWDGLSIVGQRENQTGELRVFHGNGETRTLNTSTVVLLYTRDHLGSIRELVDAGTGAVRARYDYTPYGIRTKLSGDLEADFGYTGHYTNARTGLVLAPYRAYSPELGRWISRNPLPDAEFLREGPALYRYVAGSPVLYRNPDGRAIPLIIAGVVALWGMTDTAVAPEPGNDNRYPPPNVAPAAAILTGAVIASGIRTCVASALELSVLRAAAIRMSAELNAISSALRTYTGAMTAMENQIMAMIAAGKTSSIAYERLVENYQGIAQRALELATREAQLMEYLKGLYKCGVLPW